MQIDHFVSPPTRYSESRVNDAHRHWLLRICTYAAQRNEDSKLTKIGLASALGLSGELNAQALLPLVQTELQWTCPSQEFTGIPSQLQINLAKLEHSLGLTGTERYVLQFLTSLHEDLFLSRACAAPTIHGPEEAQDFLAHVLSQPLPAIRDALSVTGKLQAFGFVQTEPESRYIPSMVYSVLPSLARHLLSEPLNLRSLVQDMLVQPIPPCLGREAFGHVERDLRILLPFLKQAMSTRRVGVNVLIYGIPGSGKSQLVNMIAHELGVQASIVIGQRPNGQPLSVHERLRAFQLAQAYYAQSDALLVLDHFIQETEESDPFFQREDCAETSLTAQLWCEHALPSNPVPTLWIAHHPGKLVQRYGKHFDLVIELGIPPIAQRERVLSATAAGSLPDKVIQRLARTPGVSADVLGQAIAVTHAATLAGSPLDMADSVERVISNQLRARGFSSVAAPAPSHGLQEYELAFVNADIDLQDLIKGLKAHSQARICCYGPPGTGKTAFGRWMADQLKMPVVARKASQLFAKYVGETELSIFAAFREAEDEGAILLLDEIDSFLKQREPWSKSWEISCVNEMLTQLESFNGIFVGTTNLIDCLDLASLRRFDLKVKFDFLSPVQAQGLFNVCCTDLGLSNDSVKQSQSLIGLTAGDFAAVVRRSKFLPVRSSDDLIAALQRESTLKKMESSRAIGFLGTVGAQA